LHHIVCIEFATLISIEYADTSSVIYLKQLFKSTSFAYRSYKTIEEVMEYIQTRIATLIQQLQITKDSALDLGDTIQELEDEYEFSMDDDFKSHISNVQAYASAAYFLRDKFPKIKFINSLKRFTMRDETDIKLTLLFAEELEKQGENIPETLNQTLIKGLTERVQERNPELQLVVFQGGKRTNRRTTRRVKKRVKKQFKRRTNKRGIRRFNRRTL